MPSGRESTSGAAEAGAWLPGTAPLLPDRRTAFGDRYFEQHARTLVWLRAALADASAARDAGRRRDADWLAERRRTLADRTGAGWALAEASEVAVSPLAGGAFAYLVQATTGVLYSGRLDDPPEGGAVGAVVVGGRATAAAARLAAAYRAHGLRVIAPALARADRSLAGDTERGRVLFSDDEYLHVLAFIVGGSLPGLEAAEIALVARALATAPDGARLPLALDLRGDRALAGAVAAALAPDLGALLVLGAEADRLDHQEADTRANTVWGFHRDFDALTLFALAERSALLFVEPAPTPSAAFGRALGWLGSERRVERLVGDEPEALAAAVAARLAGEGAGRRPPAPRAPLNPRSVLPYPPAGPDDLYRRALESKLAALETRHAAARRAREARYALAGLTPEGYRARVAQSVDRVMGPPLPEAPDRRPRTRLVARRSTHLVYEVVLESVPGVDVAGYLLTPLSPLPTGPAPAVICQHGLGGRPEGLVGLDDDLEGIWVYDRFARRLAEQGYVTFAPFMSWGIASVAARDALVKHAYALGITPNRFEVAQLHAVVDFLQSRPEVVPDRIAFYGLSYGGHASVWLGACEPRLAAVVTAGHFNDWQTKLTSTELVPPRGTPTSYLTVDEGLDMFTYDVLNQLGHAELVTRHAPRPYMVENGLLDSVTPRRWVEREYARVAAVYAWLGAAESTAIEHFPGPHRVWAEGTFAFLRRWLGESPP